MTRLAVESARITRVDSADGPVLIELYGSDGSTGLGEAPAAPATLAAAARLCASLIGMDAASTTAIGERLLVCARDLRIATPIVGGVECAVWDLLCRHLRVPLHGFLGTSRQPPVVAPGIVCIDDAADPADALVERARALVNVYQHDALLVAIPGVRATHGARALREMRRAFGDGLRIRVQCSGESNAMSARSLLDDIDDLDIDYVADAVAPITGQQRVRRTCRTPLASTLPPGDGLATWIQAGAGEVILGDPVGWGGITEFRKHAAVCRAFNLDLAVLATNMLGPAVGASLQLIVSHATASKGFHGVAENLTRSSVVTPAPVVRNGRLNVPEGPGIGWSLDAARLSARVHEQMIISSRDGKRP